MKQPNNLPTTLLLLALSTLSLSRHHPDCSAVAFVVHSPRPRAAVARARTKSRSRPNYYYESSRDDVLTPLKSAVSLPADEVFSSNEEEEAAAGAGDGTATMPQEVFSLVKSIVGAGVLSLSACIAAFANAPTALVPAVALIAAIGALSGYNFSLIGRICAYTGSKSYGQAWATTVDEKTAWIPSASCTIDTFAAVLAYSMILADTAKNLLATIGVNTSRSTALCGVTGAVLLPLCLMKNLSSLAPFSLAGIIGMGYTALAMAVRYFGGTYSFPAGRFLPDVAPALQPSFGAAGASAALRPSVFILICMLSTSYMAHYNAPRFYNELKNHTMKRFNKVVSASFGISIALCAAVASLGFLTFGGASNGCILNNYATTDALMSLSRVAVAISLIFSYPLAFSGVRDGVLDLAQVPVAKRSTSLLNKLTFGILGFTTVLALKLRDVSFVLALDGAILGNALVYVFPALMFRRVVKKMGVSGKEEKALKKEVRLSLGSAALGVIMGLLGAVMAIKEATA